MRKKRTSTTTRIVGVAVIVFALIAIFTSGSPLLNRAIVEMELRSFSAFIAAEAAKRGKGEVSFAYDSIVMEGVGFDKHAIITKPVLTIKRHMMLSSNTRTITSERIIFTPDRALNNKYYVDFPTPLLISDNGGKPAALTFAGTPRYILEEGRQGADVIYRNALLLPEGFTFDHAAGDKLQVSFSPRPDLRFNYAPATGASEAFLRADSVLIVGQEGDGIMIGVMSGHTSYAAAEGKTIPFTSQLSLIDLGFRKPGARANGFYNFKLTMHGTEPTPEAEKAGQAESDITITEATLSKDNFTLSATGTISARPDDALPFGEVKISLANFSNVRDVPGSVPDDIRPLVLELLTLATGQDAAKLNNAEFTVVREKQGVTRVGAVTFNELLNSGLSRYLPTAGNSAPAATAP